MTLRARVDRLLEGVLVVLMASLVLTVLWQVFTRFVLHDPSSWTEELARFALVWVGLLGASHAAGKRLHLAIDLLPRHLAGRRRAGLELTLAAVVGVFAVAVLGVGGGRLVALTWRLEQTSAALGAPLAAVYAALPLSGAFIALYAALDAVGAWRRLGLRS